MRLPHMEVRRSMQEDQKISTTEIKSQKSKIHTTVDERLHRNMDGYLEDRHKGKGAIGTSITHDHN